MIEIKDIKGVKRFETPINEGSKRKFMLMSEDYITLNFSLDEPIYFKLGDNVDIKEGLFELTELYKPSYNLKEGGYDYELRLDAYYYKWRNKIFKYTHGKGGEAGWKLAAPLSAHLSLFLNNLESFGYKYRGRAFEFSIDSSVDTSSKFIEYSNTNMIDALTRMAETWDCEWWVTDNVIHFGRCEYGDPVNFELGVNLESMSRNDSQDDYATRIYAFGSDRNIPKTYRANEESTVVNGVVQRRLMLDSPINAYPNMSEEEAVERVVIFDDVFPHMTSSVLEVVMDEYDYKDEEDKPTGEKYPIYTIKTDIKNFSDDYLLDELRLVFQSGKMLGMDFALKLKESDETSTTFEVIRNEDYGRFFPDYDYKPLAGNTFILYGYDTSYVGDHLMEAAESELREKAEKYVEKSKIDPSTYECALMSDWVEEDEPKRTFLPGDRVNLINKAYFENGRQSRIIGFEYNLDIPYDTPIYTVGETAAYNFFNDLESKVESLTYKGETYTGGGGGVYVIGVNDSTTPTSRNVFSALRSLAMFIRRDIPEFFTHLATFTKGLKIGNYVSGMIGGSGGAISVNEHGKTTAEFDSGVFRENIIVPKITFNNIDVISGDQASTFAYGTIKAVDTENKIAELDLLEGEYGTLKTGDILRGVFHNINGGNYKNDAYDTNGFLNYSGFATSYFTPTKILTNEPGKMVFQYELQGGTDIPPVKGMNFFAYGNFTDKERQSITYTNRLYTRRIMGVNKWTIIPNEHIKMQDGLIEGLSIGGMTMKGVGAYMTNLYIDGSFIIFTPQQLEELKGESAYSVHLTQESFTVRLDANDNIIGGLFENKIATTLGKITTAEEKIVTAPTYKQTTRIQAHKGTKPLFYASEYKEGAFLAHLQCVGCTAEIEAGEVKLTDILSKKEAYIILTVICEGNASFERRIPIGFVRDGEDGKTPLTYKIESSVKTIRRKNGVNTPSSIYIYLYEISDTRKRLATTPEGMAFELRDGTSGYTVRPNSEIFTYSFTNSIELFLSKDKEDIAHESIPIIEDGKPGTDGFSEITLYKVSKDLPQSLPSGLLPTTDELTEEYRSNTMHWTYSVPGNREIEINKARGVSFDVTGCKYKSLDNNKGGSNEATLVFKTKTKNQKVKMLYTHAKSSTYQSEAHIALDGMIVKSSKVNTRETIELTIPEAGQHRVGLYFSAPGMNTKDFFSVEFLDNDFEELPIWQIKSNVLLRENNGTPYYDYNDKNNKFSAPRVYVDETPVYSLKTNVAVIGVNSLGTLEPSGFAVKQNVTKSGVINPSKSYYVTAFFSLEGSNYYVMDNYKSSRVDSINLDISTVAASKYISILLTNEPVTSYPEKYIDRIIIPIVRDGKNGDNVAAHSMPRNCGEYNSGARYYWNEDFRDIVRVTENGIARFYILSTFAKDGVVGEYPPTSNYWKEGGREVFIAIDTALIDGADIGGFLFKSGLLISRRGFDKNGNEVDISEVSNLAEITPYIVINARTGDVSFNRATLRGGLVEPFEEYASAEEWASGKSFSWIVTNPNALGGGFMMSDIKYNGANLNILNMSGRTIDPVISRLNNGAVVNRAVKIPHGVMLSAKGVKMPNASYIAWYFTCPHTVDTQGNVVIKKYEEIS